MANTYIYNPDYCVHPGEVLEEYLETRNMKRTELAERTGLNQKTISQIINKKTNISADTALLFEKALGVKAEIWNNLDANFRLFQAKLQEKVILEKKIEWLNKFPVLEMKRRNYIINTDNKIELLDSLLDYFGVTSPKTWEETYNTLLPVYRRSQINQKENKEYICTWLRAGMIHAHSIEIQPFNKNLFKENLEKIKKLTINNDDSFQFNMMELCQEAGVYLFFEPEYPSMKVYGATLWLNQNNPLIMLSLRRKSDDQFWFSFFHEAGHILKHGKKDVFIDVVSNDEDEREQEANDFAINFLIPHQIYNDFLNKGNFYKENIIKLARELKIAPGIIVGFLQHDNKIKQSWYNDLKRKFEFVIK